MDPTAKVPALRGTGAPAGFPGTVGRRGREELLNALVRQLQQLRSVAE
jgi:hypothetical protein